MIPNIEISCLFRLMRCFLEILRESSFGKCSQMLGHFIGCLNLGLFLLLVLVSALLRSIRSEVIASTLFYHNLLRALKIWY